MRQWWGSAALLVACKTAEPLPDPAPAPPPPPPVVARANAVRVRAPAFDVTACAAPARPDPLTDETLGRLLELERPRFEACLAPATSRLDAQASADLALAVTPQGARATVADRGLAPEAVACLEARVKELGLSSPSQLSARLTVGAPPDSPPAGSPGVPEADALTSALTGACGCFAELGLNAPPQLVVHLRPGAGLDVVTTSDLVAARLERCLEERVTPPPSTLEVTLDLPLLNGDANQTSPDASAEVEAAQLKVMARRRLARFELLLAQRHALATRLESLASSLKRKPTPALRRQRAELCQRLFEVDEDLPRLARLAQQSHRSPGAATPALPALEPPQPCVGLKPEAD